MSLPLIALGLAEVATALLNSGRAKSIAEDINFPLLKNLNHPWTVVHQTSTKKIAPDFTKASSNDALAIHQACNSK